MEPARAPYPVAVAILIPFSAFQMITVLSPDPVAIFLPSDENAIARISSLCRARMHCSSPLVMSHSSTVLFPASMASLLPPGENATALGAWGQSFKI
nr:hypothetical protein [Candidatus Sigynarchaeum springense]